MDAGIASRIAHEYLFDFQALGTELEVGRREEDGREWRCNDQIEPICFLKGADQLMQVPNQDILREEAAGRLGNRKVQTSFERLPMVGEIGNDSNRSGSPSHGIDFFCWQARGIGRPLTSLVSLTVVAHRMGKKSTDGFPYSSFRSCGLSANS